MVLLILVVADKQVKSLTNYSLRDNFTNFYEYMVALINPASGLKTPERKQVEVEKKYNKDEMEDCLKIAELRKRFLNKNYSVKEFLPKMPDLYHIKTNLN